VALTGLLNLKPSALVANTLFQFVNIPDSMENYQMSNLLTSSFSFTESDFLLKDFSRLSSGQGQALHQTEQEHC